MRAETRENMEAWGLATLGALKGVPELFHRQAPAVNQEQLAPESRGATYVWIGGMAAAALWDRYASETLTHRAHRSSLFVRAGALLIGAHVAHVIPDNLDPITQFGKRSGWIKNAR